MNPTYAVIQEKLQQTGIVPVIAIEDPAHALPLADALLAGGIPIVEITFRTAAALEVIRTLARQRPQLLVGAGTVLTLDNLHSAIQAGAVFGVAPGLNPTIANAASVAGLPFIPGVATPGEIESALSLGCKILKFFPAEPLGGLEMLNALLAPYGHTGIRFMPTGGVTPANLPDYLSCKGVTACGGTWLAKKEDMAASQWDEIRNRCSKAMEIVRSVRPS